jgi:hypothetical protein
MRDTDGDINGFLSILSLYDIKAHDHHNHSAWPMRRYPMGRAGTKVGCIRVVLRWWYGDASKVESEVSA